jgi:hypothetical protein
LFLERFEKKRKESFCLILLRILWKE